MIFNKKANIMNILFTIMAIIALFALLIYVNSSHSSSGEKSLDIIDELNKELLIQHYTGSKFNVSHENYFLYINDYVGLIFANDFDSVGDISNNLYYGDFKDYTLNYFNKNLLSANVVSWYVDFVKLDSKQTDIVEFHENANNFVVGEVSDDVVGFKFKDTGELELLDPFMEAYNNENSYYQSKYIITQLILGPDKNIYLVRVFAI